MNQQVAINSSHDVIRARKLGRECARGLGLGLAAQTRLATAISELARNVLYYAGSGTCTFVEGDPTSARQRLQVIVEDRGPGIPDIEQAMSSGFSTGSSLGVGLPAARRLVHDFTLESRPGLTRVTLTMLGSKAVS